MSHPVDDILERPLVEVVREPKKGVFAALIKSFDIATVGQLMAHLPRRMQDRGESTDLRSLTEGELVTVVATVDRLNVRRMRQRKGSLIEARITDGKAHLAVTWFNAPWVQGRLHVGMRGVFTGKVRDYRGDRQLTAPDFAPLGDEADVTGDGLIDVEGTPRARAMLARPLIPIYPATAALTTWTLAGLVDDVLTLLDREGLPDPLDEALRRRLGVLDLLTALHGAHQPFTRAEWMKGRQRLAFDEALDIQLVLARRRHAARAEPATARPRRAGGLREALDARLPFALTAGQREVGDVIAAELEDRIPMQRLLQGEVGSGKTVVALRAMLQVVDTGGQAALLAPTEVLAQQHARSITAMLGPLAERGFLGGSEQATRVTLVTGSLGAKAKRAALLEAASGEAGVVVGTHALLEDRVQFADLGLVVVDEQHRFGVEQRDALRGRGGSPPHLLVMTATPIPRTVAMTVFGDLEISTLRERPAGRAPVRTSVVPPDKPQWLDRAWARLREEVAAGRQAFVVCPRVGGDEADDDVDVDAAALDLDDPSRDEELAADPDRPRGAAVLEVAPLLAAGELAGLSVGVLHGRMPPEDKDAAMTTFAAGRTDVLVATTVIEVGVDVPNAAVMVILDADRFGISQLHQLRGRIGRGQYAGVCLLVTGAGPGTPARERLDAVAASDDGFVLAEADLEARREGDVLGSAQSGRRRSLRLLSLLRDRDVIDRAREVATAMVDADPDLRHNPGLRHRVEALESEERADFLAKS